jgi:hypothetical protein
MAKEQLDGAQVGAGFEQVNREGVAQRMRADGFGDASTQARRSAGMLDGVRGDRLAEIPREEPLFRPHNPPVVTQRVEQFGREHDVAIPRFREGRLLRPLPWATRITIRWLSSEPAVKRTASEMRKPAA